MLSERTLARLAARTKERFELRELNNMYGPTPGTIWVTKPDPQSTKDVGPLVLIIKEYDERLSVVLVSRDIAYAVDDDLILEREESGLPFRCMVRTSDRFPTTRHDLLRCVGELSLSWMRLIHALCNRLTKSVEEIVNDGPAVAILDAYELMTRVCYGSVSFGLPCASKDDPRVYLYVKAMRERQYLSRRAKSDFPW